MDTYGISWVLLWVKYRFTGLFFHSQVILGDVVFVLFSIAPISSRHSLTPLPSFLRRQESCAYTYEIPAFAGMTGSAENQHNHIFIKLKISSQRIKFSKLLFLLIKMKINIDGCVFVMVNTIHAYG